MTMINDTDYSNSYNKSKISKTKNYKIGIDISLCGYFQAAILQNYCDTNLWNCKVSSKTKNFKFGSKKALFGYFQAKI